MASPQVASLKRSLDEEAQQPDKKHKTSLDHTDTSNVDSKDEEGKSKLKHRSPSMADFAKWETMEWYTFFETKIHFCCDTLGPAFKAPDGLPHKLGCTSTFQELELSFNICGRKEGLEMIDLGHWLNRYGPIFVELLEKLATEHKRAIKNGFDFMSYLQSSVLFDQESCNVYDTLQKAKSTAKETALHLREMKAAVTFIQSFHPHESDDEGN